VLWPAPVGCLCNTCKTAAVEFKCQLDTFRTCHEDPVRWRAVREADHRLNDSITRLEGMRIHVSYRLGLLFFEATRRLSPTSLQEAGRPCTMMRAQYESGRHINSRLIRNTPSSVIKGV
jgi:hypothetical protein